MNDLKRDKVKFDNGDIFKLNSGKFDRYYGVNLKIKQGERKEECLSFEFKVKSDYINREGEVILTIDRFNLRINNKKPEYAFDELAHSCGNVIYPLKVRLDKELRPQKLINHKDIIRRWVNLKKEILNDTDNLNKEVKKYLIEMQNSLIRKESIMKIFDTDFFLSALLVKMHNLSYSPIYRTNEISVKVPMIPLCDSISFNVKQKVERFYTSFNTITINQYGSVNDKRSAYDIAIKSTIPINKGDKATGELSCIYQLEKNTKVIYSIIANYSINLPYGESRQIELKAFHLKEKEHLL